MIVISHRLKSIENADKIVVMKAGTVEACGKHAHLLKQSPTYRKMIEKSNLAEENLTTKQVTLQMQTALKGNIKAFG